MAYRKVNAPKGTQTAIDRYRGFRERSPRTARVVRIALPRAAWTMGRVEAIAYTTDIAGESSLMFHEFARGSRPLVAAGTGRNQLLLIGGRYHVTRRGIVDLDARGREIDDQGAADIKRFVRRWIRRFKDMKG